LNQSSSSSGSQFFCFFSTKDHFSSSWISVVLGGKSHEFVVELSSVLASLEGQAGDGVLVDADQSCGLSDAAAVGEVGEDGKDLVLRESAVEERCGLAFAEAVLAGAAVEESVLLLAAVAHADGEVAVSASAIVGAVGVEAAEAAEVIHGRSPVQIRQRIVQLTIFHNDSTISKSVQH
jgi:hypothetical protein